MRSLAGPCDPPPLDAEGAEDGAERQVQRLEHRALLDVQLEVGGCVLELDVRVEGAVELDAVRADRVGQGEAVTVDERAELALVGHRAARGGRAEERAAEPRALLVRPVDEPDRDGRRPLVRDPAEDLRRAEDVEAAVEPATARHRVHVAAEQDGALRVAAERVPVVAGSVALDLERKVGKALREPRTTLRPGLRPRDPLRAVLAPGERAELLEAGDDAGRIERHGARA